ncbi:serine--tRNA ligase [Candidatus Saccharibacteria bacterium]|nr:serine--tRNA ligase [Candidatus Saccharibacteria bacterium]
MLDIRYIRENTDLVKENTKNKGYEADIDELISKDTTRRQLQQRVDDLREKRNTISTQLQGGRPSDELIEQAKLIKDDLAVIELSLREADESFTMLIKQVPNMANSDVPVGASEDENVVAKTVGEPTSFDFEPKNHAEIAEAKGWIDKERASKVAGSRFAYIKGDLVRLHWAMMQWAMNQLSDEAVLQDIATKAGLSVSTKPFLPVLPPLMIKTELYDAMDRLEPREDRYKIEGEELWLQGSAEHVLGSMHAEEIFDQKDLPVRYIGYATSFRKEAGTYGKDMEGIIRMHQFDKLEMESLVAPDQSYDEHLFMIAIQEYLMAELELPYRVMMKCTADIGKPNARGVDIDVWLPGQGKYRETHTADYMTDYQARRLKTRYRGENGVELVHTNDATVLSQRPLIAIIENYQTAEGDVRVPEVLRPYIGGREIL